MGKKITIPQKPQHLIEAIFELRTKTLDQNKQIPKTAAFSPLFTQRKLTKLVYTRDLIELPNKARS